MTEIFWILCLIDGMDRVDFSCKLYDIKTILCILWVQESYL